MKSDFRRIVLGLLAAMAVAFALTGCQSTPQDSSVPWGRPQSWEGQMPGVGAP